MKESEPILKVEKKNIEIIPREKILLEKRRFYKE
jgi:hypothetical protein